MTEPAFSQDGNVPDRVTAFVAGTMVVQYGDDFVDVSEVPEADLAACAPDRFAPPTGPQWPATVGKFGKFDDCRVRIVRGERGTGRRTAALYLLNEAGGAEPIYELVPTWTRPSISALPALNGARCLLDMSEPTQEPPAADFGKKLLDWAAQNKNSLVVIAADEKGTERWADSAKDALIRFRPPDIKELVARELRLAGVAEARIEVLYDRAFDEVWKSAPKVADVSRLVELIAAESISELREIADEYLRWPKWTSDILGGKDLGSRTLMWAAAFCDGGRRESVLRMSNNLRRELLEDRSAAVILSDDPASKRFEGAKLHSAGDRVAFCSVGHGSAEALRGYLWREFAEPTVREFITNWLIAQLGEIPSDDAERLALGILDVVIRFRDDDLLHAVRNEAAGRQQQTAVQDEAAGRRQQIAVRLLSRAATDQQFGTHVRSSLYRWAQGSPSQADLQSQADLVAAVCGGEFGEKLPGLALARLGWAARQSAPDSPALLSALKSIAVHHQEAVLDSIAQWLDDAAQGPAGMNAFLKLAATDDGAALLCERADAAGQEPFRDRLIGWFQRAVHESDASYQATLAVYRKWRKLAADGKVNERVAILVLGKGIETALGKNPIRELSPGFPDMDDFWVRVFTIAVQGKEGD